MDEGNVVDMLREVRKQVRNVLAALPVLLELPFRTDHPALVLLAAATEGLHIDGLAVERVELRLVVEGVDVAGPAIHEEKNHRLGPLGQHGLLRSQRISIGIGGAAPARAKKPSFASIPVRASEVNPPPRWRRASRRLTWPQKVLCGLLIVLRGFGYQESGTG